jgi:lysophospholipase L1-like esterase
MKSAVLLLLLMTPPGEAAPADPLPVHVGGRVVADAEGAMRFGWPGTYFESRFRGPEVTVVVESGTEHLRLSVDGRERAVLVRPGEARLTLSGLGPGEHVVRLDKLTESQTGGGRFIGFFAGEGTEPLPPPARARQIEYIGDSYSVGYGNTSPGRECTAEQVHDLTDTTRAFGPLLAARLGADYRVNAYSGFGIVRNYSGGVPELSLPALYPRLIPGEATPVEAADPDWRPQLIVVNLGTNDFSTPLGAGERWADQAALRANYRARYVAFARALMTRQSQARLVLMGSDDFFGEVEQVARTLDPTASGRVTTLRFGDLERTGCDWHPSLADHRALADLLEEVIAETGAPANGRGR